VVRGGQITYRVTVIVAGNGDDTGFADDVLNEARRGHGDLSPAVTQSVRDDTVSLTVVVEADDPPLAIRLAQDCWRDICAALDRPVGDFLRAEVRPAPF
jgi:hypothetical protein